MKKLLKIFIDKLFGDIRNSSLERSHVVAFSVSTGLFWCFTPTVFFQQAAIGFYWLLVKNSKLTFNFPIAWAWTWWSNPITVLPLYYFYFRIGENIFGLINGEINRDIYLDMSNKEAFFSTVSPFIWQILLGSIIVSILSACLAYPITLSVIRLINGKKNKS